MTFAHVAGVPVEELLPFALVSGAGFLTAARSWIGERRMRRGPGTANRA